MVPLTAVSSSNDPGSGVMLGSLGLMGAGSGLVVRPSTTVGVTLGRKSEVVVRRSW